MRVHRLLGLWGIAVGAVGCSNVGGLEAGETCARSVECAPGLACVGGMCTNDLSSIEGTVPPLDAGAMADGGAGMDAGMDAMVPMDSGVTPMDSGAPPMDAGAPPMDAGAMPMDAGAMPMDAGAD